MAPIGSSNSFLALLAANWETRQKLEATREFDKFSKSYENTLKALKEAGKSGDIDVILGAESMLVSIEHSQHLSRDPSVMPSLNAALQDFSVIHTNMELVRTPEAYKSAASSYHSKRQTQGVVADGCHEAMNGHVARLGNRMSAVGVSVPEKNVLRQRQANMRTAKNLYIELQCEALGVEQPKRTKGLER